MASPAVDQPGQPVGLPPLAAVLDACWPSPACPAADSSAALALLPPGQAGALRVVLRPRPRSRRRVRRAARRRPRRCAPPTTTPPRPQRQAGPPARCSGRGPLGGAAAGKSNRGSAASSATVAVLTAPSSSASRTRVPACRSRRSALPPTRTRSPIPTRRRPPLTRSRPRARRTRMPSRTVRSAASCRCHIRWNSTGSTRSRSPASSAPSAQAPPAGERLQQHRGDLRHQAPPVPVTRQPPHVRDQHRVKIPSPPVLPARQPRRPAAVTANVCRIPFRDPVIGTDIHDHGAPVVPADEEVRSMPAGTGRPHHASAARTAATPPPALPGRSPSASGDPAPARTRTRHASPSWRSTTSPRNSQVPSRTGTAGQAAPPRTARHNTTPKARTATCHRQPGTPPRTAHLQHPPRQQPASPDRLIVTRTPGNGPTIVTKPGNGPSLLTKSQLDCHRTPGWTAALLKPGRCS